jgi:hypothetical protein
MLTTGSSFSHDAYVAGCCCSVTCLAVANPVVLLALSAFRLLLPVPLHRPLHLLMLSLMICRGAHLSISQSPSSAVVGRTTQSCAAHLVLRMVV